MSDEELKKEKEEEYDPYDWTLTISKVQNGYVLQGKSDVGVPVVSVIQNDEKDELKSGEALLWEVIEYFNFGGSKHDKDRIRVIREKQK